MPVKDDGREKECGNYKRGQDKNRKSAERNGGEKRRGGTEAPYCGPSFIRAPPPKPTKTKQCPDMGCEAGGGGLWKIRKPDVRH